MRFVDELNPEQREAVLHRDGPLLILAGAGSGKTRVICYRLAYLIGNGHADASQVLAVTFTNKAAEEMRGRVEKLLGSQRSNLWISTFHSFCARLLRREAPQIGLTRDFVIYDSVDQLSAIRQAMKSLNIDEKLTPPRTMLSRISYAKNQLENANDIREAGLTFADEQLARVYERYAHTLVQSNALDFDDLLLRTVTLFDTSADARARYSERFRFVMVDEYQDTNRPQYLLVRHLTATHRNICVVGDPDQSIYKWRGADLRNILDFETDFPETKVVRLERNYRSTQVILDAASEIISRNTNRKAKRLWTDQEGGALIICHRAHDELSEADFIVTKLRAALLADISTVAVLYRTNALSRSIEDALIREGMSYKIVGGVRFYERKEIKDALAYLKLLLNPDDDVSLRRVINVPPRGIGKGVMEGLERVALQLGHNTPLLNVGQETQPNSSSLWSKVMRVTNEPLLPTRATSAVKRFQEMMTSLTASISDKSASEVLAAALDQTGYLETLRKDGSEESESRLSNLMELVSAARDYEVRETDANLGGFVDQLSLLSQADEEEGSRDAPIWLMTIHAAKGLEFPLVVIAGMEEGLFPHARASDSDEELEEERRLCYVGMTRAQSQLMLTGAARRRVFGEYQNTDPSRFFLEIPSHLAQVLEPTIPESIYGSAIRKNRRQSTSKRGRWSESEEAPPALYDDASEDQSYGGISPGARVSHTTFGIGTVVRIEPMPTDVKIIVRFVSVGEKKLFARFADLKVLQ